MRFTKRWFYRPQRGEVNPFYREVLRTKSWTMLKSRRSYPQDVKPSCSSCCTFAVPWGWGIGCGRRWKEDEDCAAFRHAAVSWGSRYQAWVWDWYFPLKTWKDIEHCIWCGILSSSRSVVFASWFKLVLGKGFQNTGPGWPLGQTSGCVLACWLKSAVKTLLTLQY